MALLAGLRKRSFLQRVPGGQAVAGSSKRLYTGIGLIFSRPEW